MNTQNRTVTIEREMAHPPEKVWRALTQRPLIEDWLMPNDFEPVVGHRFTLRGDAGARRDRLQSARHRAEQNTVLHMERDGS